MRRLKEESPTPASAGETVWKLRLYVVDEKPRCLAAFANLKRICDEHLPGRYHIEVIDLIRRPELSSRDRVLAIPTLVRCFPGPERRLIGDLSNTERVMARLELPASVGVT